MLKVLALFTAQIISFTKLHKTPDLIPQGNLLWPVWNSRISHPPLYRCFSVLGHLVVPDSASLWIVACQAPLFIEFSRQEYCHFLLQGIFLSQKLNTHLLCLQHWLVDSSPRRPLAAIYRQHHPFNTFTHFIPATFPLEVFQSWGLLHKFSVPSGQQCLMTGRICVLI